MLFTSQCVRNVYEKFTVDRGDSDDGVSVKFSMTEALMRGLVELIVGIIVANMAAACFSGFPAFVMWVLAFMFWPFFFIYYVLSKSKCAVYWLK